MTTQEYINLHRNDDTRSLALTPGKADGIDLSFAFNQIEGWQKARKKLPSWAANSNIIYPPHLSMEQCSSETAARYKVCVAERLIKADEKKTADGREIVLADLTGGFGVDFAFMASAFTRAVYVERQDSLCQLSRHNFNVLGINHAEVICVQCEDYLANMENVTVIFADPARRDEHGGRTYSVTDCTPNVLALKDKLLDKAEYVMLKLSPMLDVKKTVNDFGKVAGEVHIVSVGGECKELLLILSHHYDGLERVCCVDDDNVFEYHPSDSTVRKDENECTKERLPQIAQTFISEKAGTKEKLIGQELSNVNDLLKLTGCSDFTATTAQLYLYEPNASVMKAGCFEEISHTFGMDAISASSHLFVSYKRMADFPGRSFTIKKTTTMNRRQLKCALQGIGQANITVRNFPLGVAELRRKLKIKDGGDIYIFATTMADGTHTLFICEKAKA